MRQLEGVARRPLGRVCLTGANGCVGRAIIGQLRGQCQLVGLFRSRPSDNLDSIPSEVEVVEGDLGGGAALERLVAGCDTVIHCAARIAKGDPEASLEDNVEGTRRLFAAAAAAGCTRFVHISTTAVYGATERRTPMRELDESIEPEDTELLNDYARTKWLAEGVVRQLSAQTGLPAVIIRPTNVYGPHSQPWFARLVGLVERQPFLIGRHGVDLVHADDLARGIIEAASRDDAAGHTLILGGQMVALRDFLGLIATEMNLTRRRLPDWLDQLVCSALDAGHRLTTGTVTSLRLREPVVFSHARAEALLGYRPTVSLREGVARTVRWHLHRLHYGRPEASAYVHRYREFQAYRTRFIHDEAEIVDAIREQFGAAEPLSIRAVGGRGSENFNFHTDGLCLDLSAHAGLVSVEGPLVTVQSGMTLKTLYGHLKERGLMLPTVGEWSGQTISGVVSTATHGGSIHQGTLASSVEAVRLVTGTGEVLALRRGDPLFAAAVVSFGTLGILSQVTLRAESAQRLRFTRVTESTESYLRNLWSYHREYSHLAGAWIPAADGMVSYLAAPTDEPSGGGARELRFCLRNHLLCRLANWSGWKAPFAARKIESRVVGEWDAILSPIDETGVIRRFYRAHAKAPVGVEAALPAASVGTVLQVLARVFREVGRYPGVPVGVRFSKGEEFWLSPAYDRDTLWIGLFIKDDPELMQVALEALRPFHPRFHWGKNIPLPGADVTAQYPHFAEIRSLKARLDPKGLFRNAFADRFLAPETTEKI